MNGATTIQERLKDLRLNKGLKLEELAEQTGISKSAIIPNAGHDRLFSLSE